MGDTLAHTSLSPDERRLLEHFAVRLQAELGERLHGVWLYGSRARGEPPAHEDSDVDLIVLVDQTSVATRNLVYDVLGAEAKRLGLDSLPIWFSMHVNTLEWLRGRREIKSFYIQEVDRDKIVVVGGPL